MCVCVAAEGCVCVCVAAEGCVWLRRGVCVCRKGVCVCVVCVSVCVALEGGVCVRAEPNTLPGIPVGDHPVLSAEDTKS